MCRFFYLAILITILWTAESHEYLISLQFQICEFCKIRHAVFPTNLKYIVSIHMTAKKLSDLA